MNCRYTLGISIGHDTTASLVDSSGCIVAAVAEERLTRIKFHSGFPYKAIEEVIRIAGISKDEIGCVASASTQIFFEGQDEYNKLLLAKDSADIKNIDFSNEQGSGSKYLRLMDLLFQNIRRLLFIYKPEITPQSSKALTYSLIKQVLDKIGLGHCELHMFDHHHCHAASAFYTSGVNEAMVITSDGAGDGLSATITLFARGKAERVSTVTADRSAGRFYSEITRFLGHKRNRHEGKISGLAAYGDSGKFYVQLNSFLKFNPDEGTIDFDTTPSNNLVNKLKTINRILKDQNFGNPQIDGFREYLQKHFDRKKDAADLAAAAQSILEDTLIAYIEHYRRIHPSSNILLAGGVFANVRVNQKISELPGVKYIYIYPNMGDGGCATGAAMIYLYETTTSTNNCNRLSDVYFGANYSDETILNCITEHGLEYEFIPDIEKTLARLIHEGAVIGRFNDRMEYGPRALGNRSILARPTERSINNWLNKRLVRTEFMPFAPSVLEEFGDELFENYSNIVTHTALFMTITFNVKDTWKEKIQAAVHIDGTARPQMVVKDSNQSFYAIIEEYYKLSGIPAIINTSFNMHEEPIVNTPEDAIRSFMEGQIDYLSLGNYLIKNPLI